MCFRGTDVASFCVNYTDMYWSTEEKEDSSRGKDSCIPLVACWWLWPNVEYPYILKYWDQPLTEGRLDTCAQLHVNTYTHAQTNKNAHIHIHIHTQINKHTHKHTRTYTDVYIYISFQGTTIINQTNVISGNESHVVYNNQSNMAPYPPQLPLYNEHVNPPPYAPHQNEPIQSVTGQNDSVYNRPDPAKYWPSKARVLKSRVYFCTFLINYFPHLEHIFLL